MTRSLLNEFLNDDLPDLVRRGTVNEAEAALAIAALGLVHDVITPDDPLDPALSAAADRLLMNILGRAGVSLEQARNEPARVEPLVAEFLAAAFDTNPVLREFRVRIASALGEHTKSAEVYGKRIATFLGATPQPLSDPAFARLSPPLRAALASTELVEIRLSPSDAAQLQKILWNVGLSRVKRSDLRKLELRREPGDQITICTTDGAEHARIPSRDLIGLVKAAGR